MSPARARVASVALAVSVALALAGTWLDRRVAGTPLPEGTEDLGPGLLWAMLAFTIVGALVGARRPEHPVGWLLLATGLLWQVSHGAGDLRIYLGFTRPDLGGAATAAWVYDVGWVPPLVLLPLVALVLPTGRLLSPRWRTAMAALLLGGLLLSLAVGLRPGPFTNTPTVDNPLGVAGLDVATDGFEALGSILIAGGTIAALASLVVRFRRGDREVRQQLGLVVVAMGAVVVAHAVANVLDAGGADSAVLALIRMSAIVSVPVACGVAVLRHRLLDIDVVISKVAVYGTLAAGIVTLYVVVVVGIGHLVGGGDEPNVALAVAATATAALVFDPARRRLQRVVDRAVYGRRASPYDVLASMTRRVGATYAHDDVLDRMAQAIADATGGVGTVWVVAPSGGLVRAATWPSPETVDGRAIDDQPAGRPADMDAETTFEVCRGAEPLGALTVTKPRGEPLRPAERRLLTDLADSAALVLDNERLLDELRASRHRLVAAQDTERRRVERDLHDGAQQRLLELALTLRRAQNQLAGQSPGEPDATLAEAGAQLQEALSELRDLARGIYPAILTEQGLGAAVESLAARLPMPVDVDIDLEQRLAPPVESTAYFVVAEATANVVKHAGETAVQVAAEVEQGQLVVEVTDQGAGGADPSGGGLQGLADRTAALGGRLEVTSARGRGTSIRAVLPCG